MDQARISLVEYDEEFLRLSGQWLSDPEIKKLTMSPDINENEQKKWFRTLKERKDYLIKGLVLDNTIKIGAVGLKHIDLVGAEAEYWGYIGEKEYIGMGIGKFMVQSMQGECTKRGIQVMQLHVADFNERAIKLYERMGFRECGKSENTITMRKCLKRNVNGK
jgi:RimJ/RimL family protein N-acetyltransferase